MTDNHGHIVLRLFGILAYFFLRQGKRSVIIGNKDTMYRYHQSCRTT